MSEPIQAANGLRVHLLGTFQLLDRGEAVMAVYRPRLQALLACLLLNRGTALTRKHLAFQFWPETSEAQAQTNLRNLLHRLRQALPDPDQYIQMDALHAGWRTDAPCWLDVAEFEALARSPHAEDRARAV